MVTMNTTLKKTLIIGGVVIVVSAIGVGAYLGFQRSGDVLSNLATGGSPQGSGFPINQPSSESLGEKNLQGGVLSGEGNGVEQDDPTEYLSIQKEKLSLITTSPVVGYWTASSGEGIWGADVFVLDAAGTVSQVIEAGSLEPIASSDYGSPVKLLANSSGSRVLVWFDSGNAYLFDLASTSWEEFGSIDSAAFDPQGGRLAYLQNTNGISKIYVKDFTRKTSSTDVIASLAIQDSRLLWPQASRIFLVPRASATYLADAWYLDVKTSTIHPYASGFGLDLLGAANGDMLKQTINQNRLTTVSLLDEQGTIKWEFPFVTLLDKCVVSANGEGFCAVPQRYNKDISLTLPDDYLKGTVMFQDYIYRVDLEDGSLSPLINLSDVSFDAAFLSLTPSHLLFLNRLDGNVYAFSLEDATTSP